MPGCGAQRGFELSLLLSVIEKSLLSTACLSHSSPSAFLPALRQDGQQQKRVPVARHGAQYLLAQHFRFGVTCSLVLEAGHRVSLFGRRFRHLRYPACNSGR